MDKVTVQVKPSSTAIGKIGETLVMLELEKRGWMVFTPHFEEVVDMVAVKKINGEMRHVDIQVKTSTLTNAKNYSFKIRKERLLESSTFYFVWCCIEDVKKNSADFYVVPSREISSIMATEFKSPTFLNTGAYTFKLPLKKWMKYKGRFPE